ncbi:hypothetical protein PFISCL1PPCAC_26033, partial [Pristionchus fissidentatus]
ILILLVLSLAAPCLTAKSEHFIDWSLCGKFYAKCFIQNKCLVKSPPAKPTDEGYYSLERFERGLDKLEGGKCDTGIQVIPLTMETVVIHMQVNGEGQTMNSMGLYYDNNLIVGCKQSNGKIVIDNHDSMKKKNAPKLYQDFSSFGPNHATCKITIYRLKYYLVTQMLEAAPFGTAAKAILKFSPANTRPDVVPPGPVHPPAGELPFEGDKTAMFDVSE